MKRADDNALYLLHDGSAAYSLAGVWVGDDPDDGNYAASVACASNSEDECGLRSIEDTCSNEAYMCQVSKTHGNWAEWSALKECSSDVPGCIDNSTYIRNRTCSNPYPFLGGDNCPGNETQVIFQACGGNESTVWLTDDGEVLGCLYIEETEVKTVAESRQFCLDNFGASSTLVEISSAELHNLFLAHRRIYGLADLTHWVDLQKDVDRDKWIWLASNLTVSSTNHTNWGAGVDETSENYGLINCNPADCKWEVASTTDTNLWICSYFQVDGIWGSWGQWTNCSIDISGKCGPDSKVIRHRLCDNPQPDINGNDCPGSDHMTSWLKPRFIGAGPSGAPYFHIGHKHVVLENVVPAFSVASFIATDATLISPTLQCGRYLISGLLGDVSLSVGTLPSACVGESKTGVITMMPFRHGTVISVRADATWSLTTCTFLSSGHFGLSMLISCLPSTKIQAAEVLLNTGEPQKMASSHMWLTKKASQAFTSQTLLPAESPHKKETRFRQPRDHGCFENDYYAVVSGKHSCWHFMDTRLDYDTALETCQNETRWNAVLGSITSRKHLEVLLDIAQSDEFTSAHVVDEEYFIGLLVNETTLERKWNHVRQLGWSNWDSAQPGAEFCTVADPSNEWKWSTADCTESKYSLCQYGIEVVHGLWSDWGEWSACPADFCSYANITRNRTCDNPPPTNGGRYCDGDMTDVSWCFNSSCPINGNWSDWTEWGNCTLYCVRVRTRECTNPPPQYFGLDCEGSHNDTLFCTELPCDSMYIIL
ncbi:uncharacterized protein [Watersipora subatra]|uniref:uncharacterized protein n=1 Tax=Watersipora subatra TaxID=2589382 RepID=UPI00355B19B1